MNHKPQVEYIEANGQASLALFLPGNDGYPKDKLEVSLSDAEAQTKVAEFLAHNNVDKNTAFELVYLSDKSFTSSLVLPKVSKPKAKQLLEKDLEGKLGKDVLETAHLEFITADYGKDGLYCLAMLARNEGIVKAKEALTELGIKTRWISFYPLIEALAIGETAFEPESPIIISPHDNLYVIDFYKGRKLIDTLITPKSPYLYSEILQVAGRQQYGFAKANFDSLVYLGEGGKEIMERDDPTHLPHFTLDRITRFHSTIKKFLFQFDFLKPKAKKKAKGFSLIEVVVSLAVLSIAIGGTTGVILGMNSLNRSSLKSAQASDFISEVENRFQASGDLSYVLNYQDYAEQELGYVELTDGRYFTTAKPNKQSLFTIRFSVEDRTGYEALTLDMYDKGHNYAEDLVFKAVR